MHDEPSFKRCIDVKEISGRLQQLGINMDTQVAEHLDGVLKCFGDINWEYGYGDRTPPETDEQRKARGKLELWRANRSKVAPDLGKKDTIRKQQTQEEIDKAKKEEDDWLAEEARLLALMKPAPPEKVLLRLTSIHDLLNSMNSMAMYDRLLTELKLTEFDMYEDENRALAAIGQPYREAQ